MKIKSQNWNCDLKKKADHLLGEIEEISPDLFKAALDAHAYDQGHRFLEGVQKYRDHPYQRDLNDPSPIWQSGSSRLLDYASNDGRAILCVPSLINKHYIFDLMKGRSLVRHLSKQGLNPYLLDWGNVSQQEEQFDLSDYILKRLSACVDELHKRTGQAVTLIGYCMGGVLSTALACLEPDKIDRLVLLAAPWDFHSEDSQHQRFLNNLHPHLIQTIQQCGHLPVDILQSLFAGLDPYAIQAKFQNFARLDQTSEAAQKFVALEDWINDGIPLSGPVAQQCLDDWYLNNHPANLKWEIDGHYIDPSEITCPSLIFIPEHDRIVPPKSAEALALKIPHADVRYPSAGHIGMVCGRRAIKNLYEPLVDWLIN